VCLLVSAPQTGLATLLDGTFSDPDLINPLAQGHECDLLAVRCWNKGLVQSFGHDTHLPLKVCQASTYRRSTADRRTISGAPKSYRNPRPRSTNSATLGAVPSAATEVTEYRVGLGQSRVRYPEISRVSEGYRTSVQAEI
jgi:hypothetical protein